MAKTTAHPLSPGTQDSVSDSLDSELEAMAAIGRVLDRLDIEVRERVLRWAAERFEIPGGREVVDGLPTIKAPARTRTDDPALSVDSLDDMFVERDDRSREPFEPVAVERPPLDVMLRSFVADFQRLAEEWNGA
jgi:hypothetical protein